MKRIKLDKIDRQILRDLQGNGRMTNVELAERAGISAPPCLRRVRALEDSGYIKGYHAELSAEALGYSVTGFVLVGLAGQSEADLKNFEARIASWPMVRECHMMAGETDFLIKIVAHNWEDYQKFLTSQLTATPGVANVKSMMCMRSSKYAPGVPVDDEDQK